MLILSIRTDKPVAEIGLFQNDKQLAYHQWNAHKKLTETIFDQLAKLLESQNKKLADLAGIIVYKGPGSFTGLRIGFSVANALADSLTIPIASAANADWVKTAIDNLKSGIDEQIAQPEYGAPPKVTIQKK